jgi:hypothetical protein
VNELPAVHLLVYSNPECIDSSSEIRVRVRLVGDRALEHAPGKECHGSLVAERQPDGTWEHAHLGWRCSLTPSLP